MLQGSALADFKRTNWHQRIKLIRAALRSEDYRISTNDLLELARNELVDSRLVNAAYDVELGPFTLDKLPEQSLLMLDCSTSNMDTLGYGGIWIFILLLYIQEDLD